MIKTRFSLLFKDTRLLVGRGRKILQIPLNVGQCQPIPDRIKDHRIPLLLLTVYFMFLLPYFANHKKKSLIFYGFMNKTSAFNILTFPNIVAKIANT